jgi:sarcosine oxidase, subunit gamma
VTVEQVLPVSPLSEYQARFASLRSGEHIGLREVPFLTQLTLRAAPGSGAADRVARVIGAALPIHPNTTVTAAGLTVLWLGPDEWLVLAEPGTAAGLMARIHTALDGEHGAVVDTSAQRTAVRITGCRARDVLAHGCAIDLSEEVFRQGQSAQTLLAKAQIVLVPEQDGYLVLVRASFAGYLASWLLDAATEYCAT